jgi:hypothetical protein
MNGRRRRRRIVIHIRFRWVDALMVVTLLTVMVTALIRWPDKILVDVAIPIAILIAFVVWREH